jgi:hypothetical protein
MSKKRFSISITHGLKDWKLVFELLLDGYFKGIELPAYYLNNPKLPGLLKKSGMEITNVVDLVQPSISRSIIDQNEKVNNDIFEYIDSILARTYDFSFSCFMLDVGFGQAESKKNAVISRIQFLKQFVFTLYSNNMTMTLPVRIPDTTLLSEQGKFMQEIIRGTMFNGYKICLNLFPHEVKKKSKPESVFQWYEFDLRTVRIIYEPETGNYLTENLLEYWLKPLNDIGFKGDIIFCPKTNNFSLLENEIKNLAGFIDKLML